MSVSFTVSDTLNVE